MGSARTIVMIALLLTATSLVGCGSSSPAAVSKSELRTTRAAYSGVKIGESQSKVLATFESGNKVKLGSAEVEGGHIEEWKVEAYHDENRSRDLFITFLYFMNDKLVDTSDKRLNFRENPKLVEQWQGKAK